MQGGFLVIAWKYALRVLAACLLIPAIAIAAEPAKLQQLRTSVFRIEARDQTARVHSGSGVLVAAHLSRHEKREDSGSPVLHFRPARVVAAPDQLPDAAQTGIQPADF